MDSRQIIYPTERLLANPKIFIAVANFFNGPDWHTIADAFYDLVESEFLEEDNEPNFLICPETCIREKPEEPGTYQVILSNGSAIELNPHEGEYIAAVKNEEDLGVISAIYGRLVKAIEQARPDLKGDISLDEVPTLSNGFLRDQDDDCFRGTFSLLSTPETKFRFKVDIVSLSEDELTATVEPA